jgi:MFS family permease
VQKTRRDAIQRIDMSQTERPGSPLAPFHHRAYLVLWCATVLANIGAWMYSAAAGWLMTTLDPDPVMVAAVQAATTLPMFLFALPAGALADVLDTRRFLIAVEALIIVVAVPLAVLVAQGAITAWLLLTFTFLIEAGAAMGAPAWQSIVPRLVPREDLPAAVAASSVGFNISRAVGPALGGVFAAAFGAAAPFWVNAFSNVGSILALTVTRPRPRQATALPAERLTSAIRTGVRHARNNPPLRATVVRAAVFFFFAAAYWALLPLVARNQIQGGAQLYGMLLGTIGGGAVVTAFLLPRIEAKIGAELLVCLAQSGTAVALGLFAIADEPATAFAASFVAGACWIAGVSRLNVSAQLSLPDWVRARGLALHVAVTFGAMTAGSIAWGQLASHSGLVTANLTAAAGALVAIALTKRWRVQSGSTLNLTPSAHWPTPVTLETLHGVEGPVLVSVEYRVDASSRAAFMALAGALRRQRLRNGAYAWELFEDAADPARVVEAFHVESWVEHLRQHERLTNEDRKLEERVRAATVGEPRVTHLIAAKEQ